jgi:hypothetical protein
LYISILLVWRLDPQQCPRTEKNIIIIIMIIIIFSYIITTLFVFCPGLAAGPAAVPKDGKAEQ